MPEEFFFLSPARGAFRKAIELYSELWFNVKYNRLRNEIQTRLTAHFLRRAKLNAVAGDQIPSGKGREP